MKTQIEMKKSLLVWPSGSKLPVKAENAWFFHPGMFMRQLELLRLVKTNPYEGETFSMSERGGEVKTVHAVDNPGFAPKGKSKYQFQGRCFAEPSGLFDQDYLKVVRNTGTGELYEKDYSVFRHKGVDFPADMDTPVYSFISGTVLYAGWIDNPYGQIMIIKDATKPLVYLLAHLNGFKKPENGFVGPGDVVAFTGASGSDRNLKAWGPHFHLEVWEEKRSAREDFIVKSEVLKLKGDVTEKRRDPFDHSYGPPKQDIERID